MSINLSARQFLDHGLPERIHEVLERTGLPAGMVDLEITESASMESPVDAVALMRRLTVLGVSLSIDDFGTGYSSLAYLKLFPIHTLKIDRSFVKDIETDPNDAGICDVTVLLAHKLGLEVVAEGVETDEQLTFLRSIGCERIQGYWLSKPLPANEAEQFIRNRAQMREIGTVDLWPAG
jgi:EAL domain-containing protein (putative c-di-GMP-specific phosphodiesterase class I)